MDTTSKKSVFKPADEVIRLMLESKKQSKIESQKRYNTTKFQEILKKLRKMKKEKWMRYPFFLMAERIMFMLLKLTQAYLMK